MRTPRTIEPSHPDHDAALVASFDARHHAEDALNARQASLFYSGKHHKLTSGEADGRVSQCLADGVRAAIEESKALTALNAILLRHGFVGDEFAVGRHVFRATSPGHMALHLGAEIPTDREPEEITRSEEIGDAAYHFAQATRFEG